MGMNGLPDIYPQSLRATGLRAEGVHIRQTTSAHITIVMCHGPFYQQALNSYLNALLQN